MSFGFIITPDVSPDSLHPETFTFLWNRGITMIKHCRYLKRGWSSVENIALATNQCTATVRYQLGYLWREEFLTTSNEWFPEGRNQEVFSYSVFFERADCRADREYERIEREMFALEEKRRHQLAVAQKSSEIKLLSASTEQIQSDGGFVYLLTVDNLHWKIGRTFDLRKRLKQYNTSSHTRLSFEHIIPTTDCVAAERQLHERYASKRDAEGREWFNLDQNDVAEIKAIAEL